MRCGKCGNTVGSNMRFCPNCGAVASVSKDPGVKDPGVKDPGVLKDPGRIRKNPSPPAPKPAKSAAGLSRILAPAAAAVVLIGLVVAGVIFLPKLGVGGADRNNAFAAEAKETKNDTDEDYALQVLSAVHQTLFDTSSATVRISEQGDTVVSGKIVFGRDLPGSSFYGELWNGEDGAILYRDGEARFTDGYSENLRVRVADILNGGQSVIDLLRNALQAWFGSVSSETAEGARALLDDANAVLDSVDSYVFSLVKNNRLNFDALSDIYRLAAADLLRMGRFQLTGVDGEIDAESFSDIYREAARFIASGAGRSYTVQKLSGGKKNASYSVTVDVGQLLQALIDFARTSELFADIVGQDTLNDVLGEVMDSFDPSYYDPFRFSVDVTDGRISRFACDEFTVSVSDFDETEITDYESAAMDRYTAGIEEYTIGSSGFLIDLLNELFF